MTVHGVGECQWTVEPERTGRAHTSLSNGGSSAKNDGGLACILARPALRPGRREMHTLRRFMWIVQPGESSGNGDRKGCGLVE